MLALALALALSTSEAGGRGHGKGLQLEQIQQLLRAVRLAAASEDIRQFHGQSDHLCGFAIQQLPSSSSGLA